MHDEPPRLVGAHEIRDLLGVSRQRVYQLAGRSDFPKPVAVLMQGKIWTVDDIEKWISIHRSASPRLSAAPPPERVAGVALGKKDDAT